MFIDLLEDYIVMIIDTHCHVYNSEMENAEDIILEAAKNDIHMILNGTDPASNKEVLDLSAKYENVHGALGFLYTFADEVCDEDIYLLDKQLSNEDVVAVGEIGIDYYYSKDNKDEQKILFEKMLVLAQKHDLPVIVHSRKAMQDTFDILKKHDTIGSLHCFQGSAEMAREFVKLGFYIGVAGPITYTNNKKLRKVVNNIDITRLLVETDSPYLPPQEKKTEKNSSLNLNIIINALADELGVGVDNVMNITAENAKRLFVI